MKSIISEGQPDKWICMCPKLLKGFTLEPLCYINFIPCYIQNSSSYKQEKADSLSQVLAIKRFLENIICVCLCQYSSDISEEDILQIVKLLSNSNLITIWEIIIVNKQNINIKQLLMRKKNKYWYVYKNKQRKDHIPWETQLCEAQANGIPPPTTNTRSNNSSLIIN